MNINGPISSINVRSYTSSAQGAYNYNKRCINSTDLFDFQFKPENHLQSHIVSLLKVPTYLLNQALGIWNGFDPKIGGCYTNTDGNWNKVIKDTSDNVLFQAEGSCRGNCPDEKAAFLSKFEELMAERSKTYAMIKGISGKCSWQFAIAGAITATCLYKAYQWNKETQKPSVNSAPQISPVTKRNVAIIGGVIGAAVAAHSLI